MTNRRQLVLAAAVLFAAARIAAAQTVIVRNAPPGAPIELLFNDERVATATADATGTATLSASVMGGVASSEIGVHVSVDTCGQQRRVVLAAAGVQTAAQVGCLRGTVRDLFSLQRMTTFVIDVTGENPLVWINQGPAPRQWLGDLPEDASRRSWAAPPIGVILSGGGGGASFANAVAQSCGDAATCTGSGVRVGATAGVTYWFARSLAVDVGFLRPARLATSGSGTAFTFDGALDTRVVTIDGKAGRQIGPVRLYGLGGVNHVSALSTTVQTVTVGGTGTETFAFKADGWGWLFGGGIELWMVPRAGFYIEGNALKLKATALDNGQGSIDDTMIYATAGVRIAIGRKTPASAK